MLTMAQVPPARRQGPRAGGAALGDLARAADGEVVGDEEVVVSGVQQDSRRVASGDLFVALRGGQVDGASYLPAAARAGAVAVLSAERLDTDLPQLLVAEPRRALAVVAADVYQRPTEAMTVVGITGTNGKTTCAHLVEHMLAGVGAVPGIIGTLGYRAGDLEGPLVHTSPEADELQRVARAIADTGASHLVMEVSSIALEARRVDEVAFDVAAFTNLTQDHLDWHGSMAAYAAAKDKLFSVHRPAQAVVVVDQPAGQELAERVQRAGHCRLFRVSTVGEGDVTVAQQKLGLTGVELVLVIAGRRYDVTAPLPGEHNVQNIACAAGIATALGLDLDRALGSLATVAQVPGRLELVSDEADDVAGLVDYAHTPDALERVLAALRPHADDRGGKLWCVFGCGGDRDPDKRRPMGEVVARSADVAIVTNDNPRSEQPRAIAAAIVDGLVSGRAATHHVELDRAAAIDWAVASASPGDIVLVAGKGHEPYQIIGETVSAFDDRVELRRALNHRRGGDA
jgi:UDP-N-acetylmuramoyl-L-alanyl-D-glutamate--2,6-diaminopimelate ligase